MSTPLFRLQNKYKPANRYANFGAVIRRMQVCGFRGIADLTVDIEFPITAVSGLNGAGKSTIGQLATCAYRKPTGAINYKRFYIAQFFPLSIADPAPFAPDARTVYTLESNVATAPQDVTVSRVQMEWSGYKRQPERYCFYIGFTLYIPKVERRDMSIYGGKSLQLLDRRPVTPTVSTTVARILNQTYPGVNTPCSTRDWPANRDEHPPWSKTCSGEGHLGACICTRTTNPLRFTPWNLSLNSSPMRSLRLNQALTLGPW